MKIAICASFSFYEHVARLEDDLVALGHEPIIPATAKKMKAAANFSTDPLRGQDGNLSDYTQKTRAIREHFEEVKSADAIFVVNDEKHGQTNYIGPNVLMEMAVAFSQRKPIYSLNDIPVSSPFRDEIMGLEPMALHGNLSRLGAERE